MAINIQGRDFTAPALEGVSQVSGDIDINCRDVTGPLIQIGYTSKLDATFPPTINDDSADTSGRGVFQVGSLWVDVSDDEAYTCLDATPTAAVWINTTLDLTDLGNAALRDVGTTAGTVAAGDHNHSGVYQPLDTQLTDLSGLSYTGNTLKVVRVNAGETAFELATPSGSGDLLAANNLSDLANAGTARTNLGLAIGTNVQAYDADLTTWAGVTPGTGVVTALAVNVGSAGAPVLFDGAGGTPSSLTLTNATGLPTAGLVDDAVTLAKMAAGTAGNLITYDASGNPAAVATGTATHVLTSNGAGAAPTFQAASGGGDCVRIATASASDSSSIDFTDASIFDGTYRSFRLVIDRLVPETDNTLVWLRVSESASWKAGASDYGWQTNGGKSTTYVGTTIAAEDSSDAQIELDCSGVANAGNNTGETWSATIEFGDLGSSGRYKLFYGSVALINNLIDGFVFRGLYKGSTNALDGIRILISSGNITSGEFTLYGFK